jgi:hypothetical protein
MKLACGGDAFWYCQECAKSRGMFHWHGLCWRSDRQPHDLFFKTIERGLSDDQTAENPSNWAKSISGLTANHPAGKAENGFLNKDLWPAPKGTAPAQPKEKYPLLKLLVDVSESISRNTVRRPFTTLQYN